MISIFEVNNHLKKNWTKYAVGGTAALAAAKGIDSAEQHFTNKAGEKLSDSLNLRVMGSKALDDLKQGKNVSDIVNKATKEQGDNFNKSIAYTKLANKLHNINIWGKARDTINDLKQVNQ